MKPLESRLTRKGQVTIPLEIRTHLGLSPHDTVAFEIQGDEVKLKHAPSRITQGFGAITPRQRPEDFHALRKEFEQGVADEVSEKR